MPDALRGRLGHDFGTPDLLTQALTHRSHGARHNERLEFIGDAVLNCVVALALYERFPAKGEVERVARIHRDLAKAAGVEIGKKS